MLPPAEAARLLLASPEAEVAGRPCYVCGTPTGEVSATLACETCHRDHVMPMCGSCRKGVLKGSFGKVIGYEPSVRAACDAQKTGGPTPSEPSILFYEGP